MSWSASFELEAHDSVAHFTAYPQQGYAEEESKNAISKSIEYARDMIARGLAGANGPYKVEIGGHANPNGVPEGSWSTDTIFVRVTGSRPN